MPEVPAPPRKYPPDAANAEVVEQCVGAEDRDIQGEGLGGEHAEVMMMVSVACAFRTRSESLVFASKMAAVVMARLLHCESNLANRFTQEAKSS